MIDNYFGDYHSWDQVYTHPETQNHIFIGDLSAAQNLNFLHSQGIRTVITSALGMDQLDYSNLQLKHIVYPLLDHKRENISQFFDEFYHIVEKQIKQGSILVHCSAGISRSATLVISYLMKRESMSFRQAIELVRKNRPKVLPNLGFERQLKHYEAQLMQKQKGLLPRKNVCLTSCTKRNMKSVKLGPARSTPMVMACQSKTIKSLFQRKQAFKIRALRLRSLESRQKISQKPRSAWDIPESFHLNFEVSKVQISSRLTSKKRLGSKSNDNQ